MTDCICIDDGLMTQINVLFKHEKKYLPVFVHDVLSLQR